MTAEQIILLTPATQLEEAGRHSLPLGVLGYRLGNGGSLLKSRHLPRHRGGWLAVDDLHFTDADPHSAEAYSRQILTEWAEGGYVGVIANWEGSSPLLHKLTEQLGQALSRREGKLMVPPEFSSDGSERYVICSSPVFQGDLSQQLRTAMVRSGGRAVLAIERRARDFLLPEDKTGTPLSPGELARRREVWRPPVYFSNELCAHYFTYRDHAGLHQIIFDTENSLRRQLSLARQAELPFCLMAWPEVKGFLPQLLQ